MRRTIILVVLAFSAVAGCGAAPDQTTSPPTPPSEPPPGPNVWQSDVELDKCGLARIVFFVPSESVKPYLPPGIELARLGGDLVPRSPADPVVGALSGLNLEIYDCAEVRLNGQLLSEPVQFAFTLVDVTANETVDQAVFLEYTLEAFSGHEQFAGLFREAGFPVALAEIVLGFADARMTASVTVNGSRWYDASATTPHQAVSATRTTHRWLRVEDESLRWVDFADLYEVQSPPAAADVSAHHGILHDVAPADGRIEGLTHEFRSQGTLTFGYL